VNAVLFPVGGRVRRRVVKMERRKKEKSMAKENAVSSCAAQTNKPGDPQRTCNKQEKQNKKRDVFCAGNVNVCHVFTRRGFCGKQRDGSSIGRQKGTESPRVCSLFSSVLLSFALSVWPCSTKARARFLPALMIFAVLLFCFLLPLTPPLLVLCEVCFVLFLFLFFLA